MVFGRVTSKLHESFSCVMLCCRDAELIILFSFRLSSRNPEKNQQTRERKKVEQIFTNTISFWFPFQICIWIRLKTLKRTWTAGCIAASEIWTFSNTSGIQQDLLFFFPLPGLLITPFEAIITSELLKEAHAFPAECQMGQYVLQMSLDAKSKDTQ